MDFQVMWLNLLFLVLSILDNLFWIIFRFYSFFVNFTGAPFIKKYHLVSASSVQKASSALIDKQLITHHEGIFEVYDKFFAKWLGRL